MKMTKPVIIAMAVALVAVIGYAIYLHQGPFKNSVNENQDLKSEITRLKTTTEKIKAAQKSDLTAKIRLVEELQRKNMDLEKTVEKIRKEKESAGTDFQKNIDSIENLLAQKATEIQTSREEIQQLQSHKSDLQGKIQSLETQLVQKKGEEQISRDENQYLQQAIVMLEDNLASLIKKSADLNQKLHASKSQIERLNQEIADREESLERLAEEREYLNRETQELKLQLGLSGAQLDAISQEAVSKEHKLLALNKSYEELKMRLYKQIQEKELHISNLKDKLNIRLLNKILFDPGQTDISPKGNRVLDSLAKELKKVEGIQISVEGHTDNQPLGQKIRNIYIDNLGLSVARSAAVARKLRGLGVNPKIISAAGYSMHRPVAANAAPEGQQQNRRVEIILAPLQ